MRHADVCNYDSIGGPWRRAHRRLSPTLVSIERGRQEAHRLQRHCPSRGGYGAIRPGKREPLSLNVVLLQRVTVDGMDCIGSHYLHNGGDFLPEAIESPLVYPKTVRVEQKFVPEFW